MNDPCILPTKVNWKRTVKTPLNLKKLCYGEKETDFEYFVRLHTDIKPAFIYTISNERSFIYTAYLIAKIWTRSVNLEHKNCVYCGLIYEDYLAHIISKCIISSDIRASYYNDISSLTSRYFV